MTATRTLFYSIVYALLSFLQNNSIDGFINVHNAIISRRNQRNNIISCTLHSTRDSRDPERKLPKFLSKAIGNKATDNNSDAPSSSSSKSSKSTKGLLDGTVEEEGGGGDKRHEAGQRARQQTGLQSFLEVWARMAAAAPTCRLIRWFLQSQKRSWEASEGTRCKWSCQIPDSSKTISPNTKVFADRRGTG